MECETKKESINQFRIICQPKNYHLPSQVSRLPEKIVNLRAHEEFCHHQNFFDLRWQIFYSQISQNLIGTK